jgi:prevent-host-death family protein
MKPLNVEDILTVEGATTQLSRVLDKVRSTGHPVVITQNGKPAGVVVTLADYEAMVGCQRVREAVERGLGDVEAGRTLSDRESDAELDEVLGKTRR